MNRKIIAAAVLAAYASSSSAADCYQCAPQCVPAARSYSGLDFPRVQYAIEIPAAVRADKSSRFKVSSTPRDQAVVVVKLGSVGHAMAVIDSKRDGKNFTLRLRHANADCRCTEARDSATFDSKTKQITLHSGILKNKKLDVIDGFIVKG